MFCKALRRSLLVLTLGLSLSATASASPFRWPDLLPGSGDGVWQLLERFLQGRAVTAPAPAPAPENPKRGCGMDPDGKQICTP